MFRTSAALIFGALISVCSAQAATADDARLLKELGATSIELHGSQLIAHFAGNITVVENRQGMVTTDAEGHSYVNNAADHTIAIGSSDANKLAATP